VSPQRWCGCGAIADAARSDPRRLHRTNCTGGPYVRRACLDCRVRPAERPDRLALRLRAETGSPPLSPHPKRGEGCDLSALPVAVRKDGYGIRDGRHAIGRCLHERAWSAAGGGVRDGGWAGSELHTAFRVKSPQRRQALGEGVLHCPDQCPRSPDFPAPVTPGIRT
jgi:hypothetical protein